MNKQIPTQSICKSQNSDRQNFILKQSTSLGGLFPHLSSSAILYFSLWFFQTGLIFLIKCRAGISNGKMIWDSETIIVQIDKTKELQFKLFHDLKINDSSKHRYGYHIEKVPIYQLIVL